MANLNDAYSSILSNDTFNDKSPLNVIGVLQGRVVNSSVYIYYENNIYYCLDNKNTKIILNISKKDHGSIIEVPLVGTLYRVNFF